MAQVNPDIMVLWDSTVKKKIVFKTEQKRGHAVLSFAGAVYVYFSFCQARQSVCGQPQLLP